MNLFASGQEVPDDPGVGANRPYLSGRLQRWFPESGLAYTMLRPASFANNLLLDGPGLVAEQWGPNDWQRRSRGCHRIPSTQGASVGASAWPRLPTDIDYELSLPVPVRSSHCDAPRSERTSGGAFQLRAGGGDCGRQ
jgi:hypothetical protein